MSHERDLALDPTRRANRDLGDAAPGRHNASHALTSPSQPIASGLVMRKASRDGNGVAADADAAVATAAGSSGSSLPVALQRKFESSLGTDLSSVRVHTGDSSAAAAHAVGAKAYTVGQDIHFGAGHYDPSSATGQHLLAHEVAHTVQQRGGALTRQNKLEVSSPHDAAEHEADRAADAMVAGSPIVIAARATHVAREADMVFEDDHLTTGRDPTMAERMEEEAGAEQDAAAQSGGIQVNTPLGIGPIKLAELSSVDTVGQARACIQKVIAANANLYQRRATEKAQVSQNSAANRWREREAAEKLVKTTDGFLGRNEGVISTLQQVIDLGEGNSQIDDKGNRPGHDMRLGVFAQLAQAAFNDFARLQGVVGAFLATHPMQDQAGAEGGAQLGTAVATGGKDGVGVEQVKDQVAAERGGDPKLNELMSEYKALLSEMNGGESSAAIDAQMVKCASAISKAKNIQANTDLGTTRPDTPEQAEAIAAANKVNQELSAAKNALAQGAAIAKLAVSVMATPAIGVLGAGSALTPQINKITGSTIYKEGSKVADTASKIGKGVATATGVDVEKQVSADITTAVAKMMTDYDTKITAAQGAAAQANKNANREIVKLDTNQANVAKGDIISEFNALSKICADIEKQKFKLRAKAMEIDDHQNEQAIKRGKKSDGPDIGAMTKALAECAAYVQQARVAIDQGNMEQEIAREMSAAREKVAGGMSVTTGELATPDMGGGRELASASKADAYVDCESTPPHLLSQHPLTFRIRSEKVGGAGTDRAAGNVEVANMGVAAELEALNANIETAIGFETALRTALGF